MIELTEEYRKAAKSFRKKFGYGVPLSMLPPDVTTEDVIAKLLQCVEQENDDLLEQYGVENDTDILI